MKTVKQIISLILLLAFGLSAVFNVLFIFNKISNTLLYMGVVIVVLAVCFVSAAGIIVKNIRKEDVVSLNIFAPAKEFGILYTGTVVIWFVSYGVVMIFK